MLVAKHCLDETIISKQNTVNFSHSQLEKLQHESDQLRFRVRQLKKEAEKWGLELIELRAEAEQLGRSFVAKNKLKAFVMNWTDSALGLGSEMRVGGTNRNVDLMGSQAPPFCIRALLLLYNVRTSNKDRYEFLSLLPHLSEGHFELSSEISD